MTDSELSIEFAPESQTTRTFIPTTSVSGFKCTALYASGTAFFENVTTTESSGKSITGYYWPVASDLSFYGVYPQSCSIVTDSSGTRIEIGEGEFAPGSYPDILTMKKENVKYGTTPVPVTFEHILTALDEFLFKGEACEEAYTCVLTGIDFRYPSSGTYDIPAGEWQRVSDSHYVGTGEFHSGSTFSFEPGNAFLPGECELTVSYSINWEQRAVTDSFEKTVLFSLEKGKRYSVLITVPHDQMELGVTFSVKPWVSGADYSETI